MLRYSVYLETEEARCLAHVPDLPGCAVRAASRDAALALVPAAIRNTWAWLRRHGEPAPAEDEPLDIEVAGEWAGTGPFDPGDAAALFPPDCEPVTPAEMERSFRLMAHARADLLALVEGLPDEVLDWEPAPGSFSIRHLLRHIGNAEEWYVSRLVPPESLPPEWEHDADLPVLEFLDMERRTALERLRRLTEEERAAIVTPTHWTKHPDEPWTTRKVLRRAVEHEREHTGQVCEILEARRDELLAKLAAARAALMAEVSALDDRTLTSWPVLDGWTVKDLLAHVAAWDRWALPEMGRLAAGEPPHMEGAGDEDAFNAAAVAAWRGRSLAEVMIELNQARAELIAWLEAVPVEALFRRWRFHGDDWFLPDWLCIYWEHDADHAAHIATARAE